jgi:hypothetical protein
MATNANDSGGLDVVIVHMGLAGTMARLARHRFMFAFVQLLELVRMADVASLSPGIGWRMRRHFAQRLGTIKAQVPKGWRGQKITGHSIRPDDQNC